MYAFVIIMFNPEALKKLLVPNLMGSMASTLKNGYEKVRATGKVAFT
jgi:hypothetical protein